MHSFLQPAVYDATKEARQQLPKSPPKSAAPKRGAKSSVLEEETIEPDENERRDNFAATLNSQVASLDRDEDPFAIIIEVGLGFAKQIQSSEDEHSKEAVTILPGIYAGVGFHIDGSRVYRQLPVPGQPNDRQLFCFRDVPKDYDANKGHAFGDAQPGWLFSTVFEFEPCRQRKKREEAALGDIFCYATGTGFPQKFHIPYNKPKPLAIESVFTTPIQAKLEARITELEHLVVASPPSKSSDDNDEEEDDDFEDGDADVARGSGENQPKIQSGWMNKFVGLAQKVVDYQYDDASAFVQQALQKSPRAFFLTRKCLHPS